ncbi:hypothetical protein ACFWMZ_28095, partial [Streptomyces sp. NPDC058373]
MVRGAARGQAARSGVGAPKRAPAADALRLEVGTRVGVTTVYPSMVTGPIHDTARPAGLSLGRVSRPEPVEGVVDAVVGAATARRAPRDVATTGPGRLEMAFARHAPALADRVVRRTVAAHVGAGAFRDAPPAAGPVRRHRMRGCGAEGADGASLRARARRGRPGATRSAVPENRPRP